MESIVEAHISAAERRLAETPFPNGAMPVYVDLYRDGSAVASCALLPGDSATAALRRLALLLDADAIVHTTDAYLAVLPERPSQASVASRFEVGDPSVCEGLAIMLVSLEEGALSVRIPYARSVLDGVEFHDPVVTGLDADDRIDGSLASWLLVLLDGPDAGAAPEPVNANELAVLLRGDTGCALQTSWQPTAYGVANIPDQHALLPLLAAAPALERSRA